MERENCIRKLASMSALIFSPSALFLVTAPGAAAAEVIRPKAARKTVENFILKEVLRFGFFLGSLGYTGD